MATTAIVGEKVGMSQKWVDDKIVPGHGAARRADARRPGEDPGARRLQRPAGHLRPPRRQEADQAARPVTSPRRRSTRAAPRRAAARSVDGYEVGQEIAVDTVATGAKVDVTAVSRGKGFAGTMKRHNFKGQGASHGNHKHHRAPGAIGSCAFPGRVFKGLRMAGHMGHEQVTTLNLEVVESDPERNLLLVKGSVPGPERRRRHRPQRRQGRGEGGLSDGRDHAEDLRRQGCRHRRARRRRVRHRSPTCR